MKKILFTLVLFSCAKERVMVSVEVKKPELKIVLEKLDPVNESKCPEELFYCLTKQEYEKDLNNYKKMLKNTQKFKTAIEYYKS